MKLCVIGTRGFPRIEGGVEKHCESIYPLLPEDIQTIVYRRKPYVHVQTQIQRIQFIDLPSTQIKGFEALIHSFLATIHAIHQHPDVIHFHNIGPALFAPLVKLCSIPVVLTYHSPNYEHKKWSSFARKLLLFCEKVALKYSDRIVFVNRFQMLKYPELIRKKSVYIPNGIPVAKIAANHDFLDQLNILPKKYILSVGRITPEKGYHTLIEAFKFASLKDYQLVIAGGVEFENDYMYQLQKASENTPIIFTGYVDGDALAQLYSHAALFVLASENEGFPLVLLEAMSYERDILVSDIPATHLIHLEDEDYFPKGNAEILADKLCSKLKRTAVRSYDLSAYDWQKNADQLSAIFHEVILHYSQNEMDCSV